MGKSKPLGKMTERMSTCIVIRCFFVLCLMVAGSGHVLAENKEAAINKGLPPLE